MQQIFSNSKWLIAAVAVVALLGGALFGATIVGASGDTNDGSGSSDGVERTVTEEDDQGVTQRSNDQGVSQDTGQSTEQPADHSDDQADDRDDDRGDDRYNDDQDDGDQDDDSYDDDRGDDDDQDDDAGDYLDG